MIQIYCLVDPRNNKPFYVGATIVPLKHRLSAHIHDAMVFRAKKYGMDYTSYKKHFLIQELIAIDTKPKIELLYTSTLSAVEHYEQFFYKVLTSHGFELFNKTHQFNYLKYTKVPYYNFNKNT